MAAPQTAGVQRLRKFGPYLLVELLLPGGTLIALLLWLYRRRFLHQSFTFMASLYEAGRTQADAWLGEPAKLAAHGQVEQGVVAPARQ